MGLNHRFNEGGIRMKTKVQKWGNSLAVRIPKDVAEKVALRQGMEMELIAENHQITLKPQKPNPTLEELVSQITPENRHEEIDFGRVGKEML
jgi:antitoxin MazE